MENQTDILEHTKSDSANQEKKNDTSLYMEPYVSPDVRNQTAKKKKMRMILGICGGILLLIYFSGVLFYWSHFSPNSSILGQDVSNMSVENAKNLLQSVADTYSLNVVFKTEKDVIHIGDGDLMYVPVISCEEMHQTESPFLWFVNLFSYENHDTDFKAEYDRMKLRELVASYDCMQSENMVASQNASVRMNGGEVRIIKDVTGTVLDLNQVVDAICDALDERSDNVDILKAGCYLEAAIKADSEVILKAKKRADDFLNMKAELVFADKVVTITKEELGNMAYVDEKGNLQFSNTNISLYAKNFVETYNTSYTERNFKTHDNQTIQIYGGYYGWIFNEEKTAEILTEAFMQGGDFSVEPGIEKRGYAYTDENDIGKSYVEIDLSAQHVYLYSKGSLIYDCACVTGCVAQGHSTPGGLYGLTYKTRDAVLRGADYESPVCFWMPFNGGIGMHDASWRSQFGGTIYQYSGSHGCVNLDYYSASVIYDYVEAGSPVVCYWR